MQHIAPPCDTTAPYETTRSGSPRGRQIALVHDGSNMSVAGLVEAGLLDALSGSDVALIVQPLGSGTQGQPKRDLATQGLTEQSVLTQGITGHDRNVQAFDRFVRAHRPYGVVLVPPLSHDLQIVDTCRQLDLRHVLLGTTNRAHAIGCDERAGMATMVSALIDGGHTRIALVSGADLGESAQAREMGYLDVLAEHGLDRGPSLIVPGDDTFLAGLEAGRLLLEVSPLPSAVVATSDMMAAGVLAAAAEAGIAVPTSLSIAGFDDMPIAARLAPALTSVHIPWRTMAREAVRRLFLPEMPAQPLLFPTHIVSRASTTMPVANRIGAAPDPSPE